MILIVRTAQSTLETTNETAGLALLPPLPAGRLRQDQPRRALLVSPSTMPGRQTMPARSDVGDAVTTVRICFAA